MPREIESGYSNVRVVDYLSWSDLYVEVVSLVRDLEDFAPRESVDS